MIKVNRHRFPEPPFFRSGELISLRNEMMDYHKENGFDMQPFIGRFSRNAATKEIKKDLSLLFNGKCAYCESRSHGEVDQFRPKSSARNINKRVDSEHYFWLMFEWQNLYFACSTCNRNKGGWFPVEGPRLNVFDDINNRYKERKLFVDPCDDEPERHFTYNNDGVILPTSREGEITIEIIKLNRDDLVLSRKEALEDQIRVIELYVAQQSPAKKTTQNFQKIIANIFEGTSELPYLGIRRYAIEESIKKYPQLRGALSQSYNHTLFQPNKKTLTKKEKVVQNSYVTNVEIKNFKSIKDLKIKISDKASEHQRAPWMVFLGENGTGKSSILQAIALSLIDEDYINSLTRVGKILNNRPDKGRKPTKGSVITKTDQNEVYKITFSKTGKKILKMNDTVANYVVGYGSTRLFEQNKLKIEDNNEDFYKVGNLFSHLVPIQNAERWLLSLRNKEAFASATEIVKRGLGVEGKHDLVKWKGKIYLKNGITQTPLEDLSDGYKSTIALLVDIMASLIKTMKNFEDIEGIVIIDELELHLHPKWKMKFIKSFRRAFPKIQVFASTHDPLCLKGLYDGEVALVKETTKKTTQCFTDLPSVAGLRADQLLTSEFFGLSSTIDAEEENTFNLYYYLLSKTKLNPQEKTKLEELKRAVESTRQFGDTLRDELWMHAIDKIVAEQYLGNNFLSREDLKKETIKVLKKSR